MNERRLCLSQIVRLTLAWPLLAARPGVMAAVARPGGDAGTRALQAHSTTDVLRELELGAPVASDAVTLVGPDVAESGALVPVTLSCSAPAVAQLLLMVERNPYPLAAIFDVNDALEPRFSIRIKMSQSSGVTVAAVMADGRLLYQTKQIMVTQGGCGG